MLRPTMTTVYRSRIDAWLLIVLVAAMAASLVAGIALVSAGSIAAWWSLALIAGVGILLPSWLLLGTRYTLAPERLTIRSGPFAWQVPLADITGITPTRNPLSSPALSLDRLRIDYGPGRSVMISPRDKARFIQDLEALRHGVR